jgi:hypothetical protein
LDHDLTEHVFSLEHEISRLDDMTVRVVIGEWAPVVGEIEIHYAGLQADFVAVDGQEFLESLAQGVVLPDLVKLCE